MPGITPPKLYCEFTTTSNLTLVVRDETTAQNRTATIAAGTYFIRTHGGSPADSATSFVAAVQTAVRAATGATEFAAFTCTISDTGFVVMTNPQSGGDADLKWRVNDTGSSDDILTILGIEGDVDTYTGADGILTASDQARYTWHPNVAPSDMSGDPDLLGVVTSDTKVTRSPAGQVTSTSYREWTDRDFEFRSLHDEYVYPTGSVENRDYQQFWSDAKTKRIRYYYDRTVQTAPDGTGPWEYKMAQKTAADGTSERAVKRQVAAWAKLYTLDLSLHKYVSG